MPTLTKVTCASAVKLPAGNFALNRLETIGDLAIEAEKRGKENG
jgi:hypothetical protein